MSAPRIGERYRGTEGYSGYLLRQAWQLFQSAMDVTLREHRLSSVQYGVLSVLRRDPGMSGADLARAINTTPQAVNGVLATLERGGLIERRSHPTHGRILQTTLTAAGRTALDEATPSVRALEAALEEGLSPDQLAAIKAWLVASAQRMEQIAAARRR